MRGFGHYLSRKSLYEYRRKSILFLPCLHVRYAPACENQIINKSAGMKGKHGICHSQKKGQVRCLLMSTIQSELQGPIWNLSGQLFGASLVSLWTRWRGPIFAVELRCPSCRVTATRIVSVRCWRATEHCKIAFQVAQISILGILPFVSDPVRDYLVMQAHVNKFPAILIS